MGASPQYLAQVAASMPADPNAPMGPPVDYSDMSPQAQYEAARRAQTPVATGATLGAGPPASAPQGTAGPPQSYDDWAAENGISRSSEAPRGAMNAPVPPPGDGPISGGEAPAKDEGPGVEAIPGTGGAYGPREVSRLGPTQWAALNQANEAQGEAVDSIYGNTAHQAQAEEAMYLDHARRALKREDAANAAALEREDELNRRAMDFDRSAKQLANERIDPDRFWASRSTPQKISSFISIALGGFLSGARGGPNQGLEMINHAVDRDINAQEFAYRAKHDSLEAQHSAFGLAMQKYQSIDAARAFARVAAMDAIGSEISRQQARWKGTEGANRANAALAEIQQNRADQLMKGIQFVQGGYAEPKYRVRGRMGAYTAKEIDAMLGKKEEQGFELDKIDRHAEGEIRKEQAKGETEDSKYIANAMQQAGIPAARSAAEAARQALLAAPKGYGERVFENTPVGRSETARKVAFGKEAQEREQTWMNFKNSAMKTMMGNVTGDEGKAGSEVQRAKAALEGANDNESRLNAIKFVQNVLNAQEENIRRGASERGAQSYDSKQVKTGGVKPLAGVKSFVPSKVQ